MSGIFTVSVAEARGFVAVNADLDKLAVVIGRGSTGSGQSPFYMSGSAAVSALGYGDGVDALCQIIEQRQASGASSRKFPAAFYTVTDSGTRAAAGTINNGGWTGTSVPSVDGATAPLGTYEAAIKIITGGTVGTAGITYQWSLDGQRTWSNTTALGTSDTITIPNSGVIFHLAPGSTDLTALNTLINNLYTKFNAHVILTTGTVHSNADNADVVSIASATSTATRVARINALKAAYELHRVKGSGGSPAIHINAPGDTTNAITAPNATDDESALVLALDFKAKYNAHLANTTVHTIADGTNTDSDPAPSAGTAVAGDVTTVRTLGGIPSTSDVDAAFTALANSTADFALVVCEFACSASMAAHITTGLNALKNAGKRCTALIRTRLPDFESSETDAAWNTSVAADFNAFSDSRICPVATYGLLTDAMTTRQYKRSDLAQWAADVVRVGRPDFPDVPADQPEANFRLVDSTGATVGHDEGVRGASTGLSDDTQGNRFRCHMRFPDPTRREDVFSTVPWVLYASDERIRNLPTRRIANAMERVATAAGTGALGAHLFYLPSVNGSDARLTTASRNAIHGVIFNALAKEFADDIQNAHDAAIDTGLVQINPVVTVTGGNLLSVTGTLAPLVFGYLLNLSLTLAVQQ